MNMLKRLIIALCAVAALAACEVIPEGERYEPVVVGETRRVVLLEEFTGVNCPNCPTAAQLASSLLSQYPDNLVVVGLHGRNTGHFGEPFPGEQDFRIAETSEYFSFAGGTPEQSYPCGMVNRAVTDNIIEGTSCLLNYDVWATEVVRALTVPPVADITMELISGEAQDDSVVTVAVSVEAFETVSHPVSLVVELVEDSIVGSQSTESGVNADYAHNHVLRTVVNGTWGESFTMPAVGEISSPKEYEVTVRKPWVKANCSVVAYLYNSKTRGDVMQAAILPLGKGAVH